MIVALTIVGLGFILALGGMILLDRRRFDRSPRAVYAASTLLGAAMVIAPALGMF